MKTLYCVVSVMFLIACSPKQSQSHFSATTIISKDTTITYDLEDISSEGTEVVAHYVNGMIDKSKISIYGSMGQVKIVYEFTDNQIKVTEKDFQYQKPMIEIQSDNDIKLVKDFSYTMDLNGVPLEKVDFDRTDIFQEFKQAVPFALQ